MILTSLCIPADSFSILASLSSPASTQYNGYSGEPDDLQRLSPCSLSRSCVSPAVSLLARTPSYVPLTLIRSSEYGASSLSENASSPSM